MAKLSPVFSAAAFAAAAPSQAVCECHEMCPEESLARRDQAHAISAPPRGCPEAVPAAVGLPSASSPASKSLLAGEAGNAVNCGRKKNSSGSFAP